MKDSTKKGWVRLHRQIEDNFLWLSEPFTKAQAWIDLFMSANHVVKSYFSIRGNIIELSRGELAWSEDRMCDRWKWSKNKVRRFLKLLETENQIEIKKSYIVNIISIKEYESFQADEKAEGKADEKADEKAEGKHSRMIRMKKKDILQQTPEVVAVVEAPKEEEPFNYERELDKMRTDNKRHIQIIATFLDMRRLLFNNKKQISAAIRRHSKPASILSSFSDEQLGNGFAKAQKIDGWTLETVLKMLTK